tara:strand:+ start:2995 stop:3174 length:180 start_codon:yes stop_codon:yes gene_type:complete
MPKKDLDKFLNKISQLNSIVNLINESKSKREELTSCKTHEEVIKVTTSWGFNIGSRWGE